MLQDTNMNITLALESIENLKTFLQGYRSESKFKEVLKMAKELSEEVDGEQEFKSITEVRQRKKIRLFNYEHHDETPQSPEDKFKVNVFYTLLDVAMCSTIERFEQLKTYFDNFSFLIKLPEINNECLRKHCNDLEILLTDGDSKDINALDLYDELCAFRDIFQIDNFNIQKPFDILNYIVSNNLSFPNFSIALRILLTLLVSVASGERSFSKLKLIKTYLRTSMTQDRLNNLALISIENDVCAELDVKTIISSFLHTKSRISK